MLLCGVVREDLSDKVTFEQIPVQRERVNLWNIKGKSIPDSRKSKCQGPEVSTVWGTGSQCSYGDGWQDMRSRRKLQTSCCLSE